MIATDGPAIEVRALVKRFGHFEALRGLDLQVPRGALFGLLGPNGAGKSTLIKALVGSLRPTAGNVTVLGLDPLRDRKALRRQIGYMPQGSSLYQDLSARDNIGFFGAAHGAQDLAKRVEAVLALTELASRANEPVRQFSGGMQRRVSLAAALVHEPRMLLLDEPTAAVDPALRARFWDTFRALASRGATLFISTHLMDEAMLCDRVAILRDGKVILEAPPRQILARGGTRLTVRAGNSRTTTTIGSDAEALARALRPFGLREDVQSVEAEQDSFETVLLRLFEDRAPTGGSQ